MEGKHRIESVEPHPASGPGALDGWEAACSCGFRLTTSLSREVARREMLDHVDAMQLRCHGCGDDVIEGDVHNGRDLGDACPYAEGDWRADAERYRRSEIARDLRAHGARVVE
jgi:hypothetical protein